MNNLSNSQIRLLEVIDTLSRDDHFLEVEVAKVESAFGATKKDFEMAIAQLYQLGCLDSKCSFGSLKLSSHGRSFLM